MYKIQSLMSPFGGARQPLPALVISLGVLAVMACSDVGLDVSNTSAVANVAVQNGNAQLGVVGTALATPLTVLVTNASGAGVPNITVTWTAGAGSGAPSSTSAVTDANGVAHITWTLGPTVGPQTMTAVVTGFPPVTFTATAASAVPVHVSLVSGDQQTATAGTQLSLPLVIAVTDQSGNPVVGAPVIWRTVTGGSVSDSTTTTDASGRTQVFWTLGVAGTNGVTATVGALPPVLFTATGI